MDETRPHNGASPTDDPAASPEPGRSAIESTRVESRRAMVRLLGVLLAVVAAVECGIHFAVIAALPPMNALLEGLVDLGLLLFIGGPVLWHLVMRPHMNALERERAVNARQQAALSEQARSREFDSRLHRAFEIARTEAEVRDLLDRALKSELPDCASELLLADSSRAHLRRVVAIDGPKGSPPQCPVASPWDCVAARQGQALAFPSSEEIDACPKLRGRACGPVSASCVPLTVNGRAIGVLHAVRSVHEEFSAKEVHRLRIIAEQASLRIGMLRAMDKSQLQAAMDGLTGILNRRSFETRARAISRSGSPFAVVMCDLDHFKVLNDTHGHEAGDRALRLFGRVLRASFRAEDVVARYGGEEFVVMVPGADSEAAARAAEDVRKHLCEMLARASTPSFTASFGVADSTHAESVEDVVHAADEALYEAKNSGRDRVAVSTGPSLPVVERFEATTQAELVANEEAND